MTISLIFVIASDRIHVYKQKNNDLEVFRPDGNDGYDIDAFDVNEFGDWLERRTGVTADDLFKLCCVTVTGKISLRQKIEELFISKGWKSISETENKWNEKIIREAVKDIVDDLDISVTKGNLVIKDWQIAGLNGKIQIELGSNDVLLDEKRERVEKKAEKEKIDERGKKSKSVSKVYTAPVIRKKDKVNVCQSASITKPKSAMTIPPQKLPPTPEEMNMFIKETMKNDVRTFRTVRPVTDD